MNKKDLSGMSKQELIALACHLYLISDSIGKLKGILKGNKECAEGPLLEEVYP